MAELFLIALGAVLLLLLFQRLEQVERSLLFKTLKWTCVGVLVLVAVLCSLTGRLLHVAAILILIALLVRKDVKKWTEKKKPPLLLEKYPKKHPPQDQKKKRKKQDKA